MQDVKSLYHAAKSSGHPKDISAYAECVQDLYEHNPATYISNLEYIISSDIGLKTFNGFVEKYGLPIGAYDSVMECVNNCIDRCSDTGLDPQGYTEIKRWLEGYKQKYQNCFCMYEFYRDTNDDAFIKTYYSMNDKGVQNSRLIKGMIEKFNETAIPDILITSDRMGAPAVKQTLSYLSDLYNMGNCTYSELANMPEVMTRSSYLVEAVQDLAESHKTAEYERMIYPYTYHCNVARIHIHQNEAYRESMMSGDSGALYEYSQFDIDMIKGLIEFDECKIACLDDPDQRMQLQKEIYSLYESLDGYITESGDTVEDEEEAYTELALGSLLATVLVTAIAVPTGVKLYHIYSKDGKRHRAILQRLSKLIGKKVTNTDKFLKQVEPLFKRYLSQNISHMTGKFYKFNQCGEKYDNKISSYVTFGGTSKNAKDADTERDPLIVATGPILRGLIKEKDAISIMNSLNKNTGLGISVAISTEIQNLPDDDNGNDWSFYIKSGIVKGGPEDGPDGDGAYSKYIDELHNKIESSGYVVGELSLIADVETLIKRMNGDVLKEAFEYVEESYVGTKHTGSIPTYLSKHHDMAYGGEETTDDMEKYRRKSATQASEPEKPKSDPDTSDTTVEPSTINPVDNPTDTPTPEEQRAINNYYYYTYTNSNNRNTNSFNRHHTSNDDHSTNKRIHSDDINGKDDVERIVSEQLDQALLETIEGKFIESLSDIIRADDFYTEASGDKKFKYAYKAAYNYANGHALKITYSLDTITITDVGDLKPLRDAAFSIIKKYADDATRGGKISGLTSKLKLIKGILGIKGNVKDRKKLIVDLLNEHIKDVGYVDFQAKDCTVVEIYDRADKKRLKDEVQVVGIYAAADYNKDHSLVLSPYAYDRMKRRVESRHSNFKISTIKVGSIQKTPTFMTTHWDDHADHGLVDSNGQLIKDDGQDRDNSSLIQTAREAHGYDFHQNDVKLTDALADFIDPIKDLTFIKGRKKSGEFETQISNNLISEQSKLVENLKKAVTIVNDPNDASELQKMLDAESGKLNSARSALKTNDHEAVFNTLEHLEDSVKRFDSTIKPLSKKYSKLIHIMSQLNLNESNISVSDMFDLRIDRILSRGSIMMEAVGDADDNKPESDHPIKDTFTDIDRATTRIQQKAKKKVQDIENVGRAVAKPVKRTQMWIGNMVGRWKDADETKIKERLADPHERSGIMYAIKAAIQYGSLAKAGLLLNPVIMFLTATKVLGKNKKMQRIRNEMIGELKTEISILDEKIKDAASNNDLKAKYQMMRFRNELNKKLIRVGGTKRERKVI